MNIPIDFRLGPKEPAFPKSHPYRAEVLSLLNRLTAAGFRLDSVHDGMERIACDTAHMGKDTIGEALETILSVDSSWLRVTSPLAAGFCLCLFLVLGNGPGELVADWTTGSALLESVLSAHNQQWEG